MPQLNATSDSQRVAVIIVNWNGGLLLRQCLEHLSRQTLAPSQIIVFDNASSDDSAVGALEFDRVQLIRSEQNLGFAAGNNRALHHCDCELVALLNADAFADPNWLQCLVQAATDRPDAAAFSSLQLNHDDPSIADGFGDAYHLSGLARRIGFGVPVASLRNRGYFDRHRDVFSACAAAALYRREALRQVGGFDEDYFCYFEDIDLSFRLRLAGHAVVAVPQAIVRHMGSASSGGYESDFSVYYGHRNMVWVFVKNMPKSLLLVLLPLHLLANILILLRFTFQGRASVILRAKYDAVLGLRGAWRKRRHIQSNRVVGAVGIWRLLSKRWTDD